MLTLKNIEVGLAWAGTHGVWHLDEGAVYSKAAATRMFDGDFSLRKFWFRVKGSDKEIGFDVPRQLAKILITGEGA